jgi:hypothetical protein
MLAALSWKLLACALGNNTQTFSTCSVLLPQPILLIISLLGLLIWIPLKVRGKDAATVPGPDAYVAVHSQLMHHSCAVGDYEYLTPSHAFTLPQILGCIFGCCCPCACLLSCVETIFESE